MNFEIGKVESFTTGTVGPKGQRTFFLQAIANGDLVTLKLEKQQVLAMAEHLQNLLADLPEIAAHEWTNAPALVEPTEVQWTVGALGAMYDTNSDCVVVMAEQASEDPEAVDLDTATFLLGRAQTLAFIERARQVVEAGRPPCIWCGRPLNYGEDGFCPCWN